MKVTLDVKKTMKITLADLAKLLKLDQITDVEVDRQSDYRGESYGTARSITITVKTQEEREV